MCHVLSLFLSSLSWCCRVEAGRTEKGSVLLPSLMLRAQSLITLTQWEKKVPGALLSSPCPTCWAAETFPEENKKKNKTETKQKNKAHKKKTPKPPNLSTKPTNGLYRLKNSQQDRTSPGMSHFIAHNPFTLSPSLQYQCCRWALATAAVWPGLNSNSILQLKTRMNCCQRWKIVYLNLPDLFLHRWYQSPVDGLLSTHMNKTQAGAIY